MQDRYAADIGDFGKFQLLRYLFNGSNYHLCQLWYKFPNESHNSDGLHINYFDKVKGFDPLLEQKFYDISLNDRTIQALEDANLLDCVSYFQKEVGNTLEERKLFINEALEFAKQGDFILADPDNGLATALNKATQEIRVLGFEEFKRPSKPGKYIYLDEIQALHQLNHSLILYHHLNRTMAHDLQISKLLDLLNKQFGLTLAIKHKPYSPRVYFFILKNREVYSEILEQLQSFEEMFSAHWQVFHQE